MDHRAKDIYRWGIFSAEVYPRSSIAIQGTVWMSWISCPLNDLQYRWVSKFRTHGTVHNLNRKDTNRQSHSGQPKSSRTPHNVAAVRVSVVHSPSNSVRRRSQELGINRESVRRILIADSTCILTGYRWKKSLHLTTWGSERSCASGFATRLTLCQTFLTMSGFRTRHIFCCQVTWTLRTTSSGVAHPLSTVCKGHYTLWSALPGLPSPNMALLDHSGSRTTTSGLWQSGAHLEHIFWAPVKPKSFCSTDLKLWRCLLHRLDLMLLKFCVNLNKILEVIRFLVMTVFFVCHPVYRDTWLCNITAQLWVKASARGPQKTAPWSPKGGRGPRLRNPALGFLYTFEELADCALLSSFFIVGILSNRLSRALLGLIH